MSLRGIDSMAPVPPPPPPPDYRQVGVGPGFLIVVLGLVVAAALITWGLLA